MRVCSSFEFDTYEYGEVWFPPASLLRFMTDFICLAFAVD